ncbi:MAG TPA: hypothetical protein VH309_07865 [Elusimicrobiota bacterium]|nr:hypothetical protein [Elusimicrobiota bacterium]
MKEFEYPWYTPGAGAKRVSWGAVFAGAITSVSVMFTLILLGLSIGLYVAPAAGTAMATGVLALNFWKGVWLLGSGIVSFYTGGWIAGRLNGIARIDESVIHGAVSWGLATLASGYVLFAAGAFGAAAAAGGSLFYFFLLAVEGLASCVGARDGTCVLKPVPPVSEPRREKVGV